MLDPAVKPRDDRKLASSPTLLADNNPTIYHPAAPAKTEANFLWPLDLSFVIPRQRPRDPESPDKKINFGLLRR
ncbi:MAG: hypothetical protein A2103_04830 [Gammaproteobacteria bacterium GWF2_41_13]|nr:MAG: hypothetical protein A2103_04830 [Gammaproteobacteria bacterium GWF2_41_13]